MKITKIIGREIYDSRGWPTVQCELLLDDSTWVTASVPSGLSRGRHEACELLDGGKRLWGRGVLRAIENIEYVIAPALVGKEPHAQELDMMVLELDGTQDKSHLGANAMLAVSMALYRAQAAYEEVELFELFARLLNLDTVSMPFPQFNMINGGVHADNKLCVQEMLVVPVGTHHFRSAMEYAIAVSHELKALLQRYGRSTLLGDEGGFAPHLSIDEALLSLCEVIDRVSGEDETRSVLALDMAASQLFDAEKGVYTIQGRHMNTDELIEWYQQLVEIYPIYSLEDPLAEDDWEGWIKIMQCLGDKIQIVADDLCVTNTERIVRAIEEEAMTAVVIKPNQVGTITETLQAIQLCRQHEINTIISHRSGETNDNFIADLSVGSSSGQIKAGGCSRGERMAKYNRLLAIEDTLLWGAMSSQ